MKGKKAMKFQAYKGTRDFYPEDMRIRNYILDAWRRVSIRNGFEEYDGPVLEPLGLFTVKSGQEIVEQLFNLIDRGGRELALRPEITPSLARMVAAKIQSLPRPIKWFSVPRLWRAERPQRGRLREFFQWNADIIGCGDVQADAECIYTLVDFLREMGLPPADVQVRVGSRPLAVALLRQEGVKADQMDKALLALDKRQKIPQEAFEAMLSDLELSGPQVKRICEFLDVEPADAVGRLRKADLKGMDEVVATMETLSDVLRRMGAGEYVVFDWHIVRGLAYYTGVVYEAIASGERAVAGGGRYDRLLEIVGGPETPATGFGMGDVVLGLLLEEKGKLPAELRVGGLDYFVIDRDKDSFSMVLEVVAFLRTAGKSADYSFYRQPIGKQLKEAARRGARQTVLIGPDRVSVKTMSTGEQFDLSSTEEFKKTIIK
jgi:histidyl-tRNA synthetase